MQNKWLAVIGLVIGTFMVMLDSSIVNVAIPKMMAVFSVGTDQIEWVLTAYMLTMGVVIPLSGYLGDRFGLKKLYIIALGLFTAGSAICGFAWNNESLVAARIIQALGGGLMMPVSMTLLYKIFPREEIGLALGMWGIAAAAAPAIGPTLSGYIVEYLDWRLIFTINIPIGIATMMLNSMFLENDKPADTKKSKFDYVGAVTVIIGMFSFILALNKANDKGWTSGYILALLAIAIVSLTIFVFNEIKVDNPLLDLGVFKDRQFSLNTGIMIIMSIAMFGGVFILPLYLQNLKGLTALQTGVMMFPAALVTAIVSPISGRLYDKFGGRPLIISGMFILGVTTYYFSKLAINTPREEITYMFMFRSLGMALAMMAIQTAGLINIGTEKIGNASAISNTFRQIGGSFGIALMSSILTARQSFHMYNYGLGVNLSSVDGFKLTQIFNGMGIEAGLNIMQSKALFYSTLYKNIVSQAMMTGIDDTFLIACLIAFLGCFLGIFVKKKQKKNLNNNYELVTE